MGALGRVIQAAEKKEKQKPEQVPEAPVEPEPEPIKTYLGRFYVTGYDICLACCGKLDGVTASLSTAQAGRTVAAPDDIPFGTILYIDGIGERVVEDRGEAITGKRLDALCEDHNACFAVTGWHDVYILEAAE